MKRQGAQDDRRVERGYRDVSGAQSARFCRRGRNAVVYDSDHVRVRLETGACKSFPDYLRICGYVCDDRKKDAGKDEAV